MHTTYPDKTRQCLAKWYSDPGHAWLGVEAEMMQELGIAEEISSYSYLARGIVYLEEDCDAPRFFHAVNLAGYEIKFGDQKHYQNDAPIRRMGRFTEYAKNYSNR
jgi:hypothetical protein